MQTATPSPTVLVIADDSNLVESLRGAFGSTCEIMSSSTVDAGLERVVHLNGSLRAVMLSLGLQGLDAPSAVQAVRKAHGDVTLLGFTPETTELPRVIEGCQVVPLPHDLKDVASLAEIQSIIQTPERNGHEPAPEQPTPTPAVEAAPPVETVEEVAKEQSIAFTFLRDSAERLEHANYFEARSLTEHRVVAGRILRVSPSYVVCEVLDPQQVLPPGWSAEEARVQLAHRQAYLGPARLSNVVNTGSSLICEWALQAAWQSPSPVSSASVMPEQTVLGPFFERMKILHRISEVFKAVVSEVASVLEEAKQCLDRIEISLQPAPGQTRAEMLRAALPELQRELFPAFDQVFAKFEQASAEIPPDLDAEYHSLVRQRLHPLMMCAPFIHHVYAKPLGFAGDYGALHKLIGDPFEGQTLYAKLLNAWLVLNSAGEAYRHRLWLLGDEMRKQAAACHQRGREMRVLSIGCGAANEVVRFFAADELSHSCEFTLVDFNEVTLGFAKQQVEKARQEHWRLAKVNFVQSSIQSLVLDESRMRRKNLPSLGAVARAAGYDFVYCTGLFDYFSERVCRRLTQAMLGMLAPGGRMIICNFTPKNPIRHFMKYVLDWDLVHRTPEQLRAVMMPVCDLTMTESPGGTESYLIASRKLG